MVLVPPFAIFLMTVSPIKHNINYIASDHGLRVFSVQIWILTIGRDYMEGIAEKSGNEERARKKLKE